MAKRFDRNGGESTSMVEHTFVVNSLAAHLFAHMLRQHILPPWITTLSLALLLSYITNNLLKKARVISAKDRERSQAIRAAEAELDSGGGDVYTSISTTHLADVEEGGQNGEAGSTDDLAGDEDDISRPLLDGEATPEPEAAAPRRLRKRDRVRRLANNALEHYQPEVPWVKMLTLFALLGCTLLGC